MTKTVLVVIFWLFLFLIFFTIDRLFKYEYEKYNDQWISDGKPSGLFWGPKGSSVLTRDARLSSWVFFTPDWIKRDRYANFLLWLHRLLIVLLFTPYVYWKIIS